MECYSFYVKPPNKHKCIETINSTPASAQISFYFWHYQWRQQPQASFWWGKLYKHSPSLTFQIRSVKLTSRNEKRGEVNLAMNAALPHCPCKHRDEMFMFQWHKTCLFAQTYWSHWMEKVGLRGKGILCQLSALWPGAVRNCSAELHLLPHESTTSK